MPPRRARTALAALAGVAAVLAAALPALGQEAPQSILPPGFGAPPQPTPPASPPPSRTEEAPASGGGPAGPAPQPLLPYFAPPPVSAASGEDDGVAMTNQALPTDDALDALNATQPEEMPAAARRSLELVGPEPAYGQNAFGDTDGRYLVTLMRRVSTPIASRWAEITLRRMLLGATPAPAGEGQADWVADRASLLLRLGEAAAARMLVQSVDVENYSPRLRHVAIQAALATADPQGLCPLPDGQEEVSGTPAWPMIRAMCATIAGDAATANASIGRTPAGDPIDHALAEKLVAAGGAGRRNVAIDWTAVDALTDWRFGIASALGVLVPQSLLDAAPAWMQAWLAQAPMLSATDRIAPARVGAALGPVSSADLVDLYARGMDESGAEDRDSPAGRLRAAYNGDDDDARLSALHALWSGANASGPAAERDRYAGSILTAHAATGIAPASDRRDDVAPLVAAMFAGGFDRQAARWRGLAEAASGRDGDRAWAMLAVGAEQPVVTVTAARVQDFQKRAGSGGAHRTAMLAAALAGLGRMSEAEAAPFAAADGATLGAATPYARALARAADARAPGTVALLAAVGMQDPRWAAVPPADFYRAIAALHGIGLDGEARMIAAEAMARL